MEYRRNKRIKTDDQNLNIKAYNDRKIDDICLKIHVEHNKVLENNNKIKDFINDIKNVKDKFIKDYNDIPNKVFYILEEYYNYLLINEEKHDILLNNKYIDCEIGNFKYHDNINKCIKYKFLVELLKRDIKCEFVYCNDDIENEDLFYNYKYNIKIGILIDKHRIDYIIKDLENKIDNFLYNGFDDILKSKIELDIKEENNICIKEINIEI
jgi:hypothetical protein